MRRMIAVILVSGAIVCCGAGCLDLVPKGGDTVRDEPVSRPQPPSGTDASPDGHAASSDSAATSVPSGKRKAVSEFAGAGVETHEPVDLRLQPEAQPPATPQTRGVELLPQSDDRKLSRSDLAGFSNWELTLARNEIYARHGRPFSNASIRAYFQNTGWYVPNSSFRESSLSAIEQQNAAFIRDYQASVFGSPATKPDGGGVAARPAPVVSGEILPQSDDRFLTNADLSGYSNWQLTLARNEIYARHGRPFNNASIRAYFQSTGWYVPKSNFRESWLTQVESRNAEFIRNYQVRVYGSPATRP